MYARYPGDLDAGLGRRRREEQIVAVAVGGARGLELETAQGIVERGADLHAFAPEVRVERPRRRVEAAGLLRAAFEPAEPVEVPAVGGFAAIAESRALVVIPIEVRGGAELAQVAHATQALGQGFAPAQHRQEQAGQDRDDGDDHQEFDQGEGGVSAASSHARPRDRVTPRPRDASVRDPSDGRARHSDGR